MMINGNEITKIADQIKRELKPTAKYLVYTVVFGNYDLVRSPKVIEDGIDYICICDHFIILPRPWKLIIVRANISDKTRLNRLLKIEYHLFFSCYSKSLYIDGNIQINTPIKKFIEDNKSNFTLRLHPYRNCVYQEALECVRRGKDSKEVIEQQMASYKQEGFPENYGLSENNILLRAHNKTIEMLMDAWWYEVNTKSRRDQLSLQYVIWKQSFSVMYYKDEIAERKKRGVKNNRPFAILNHTLKGQSGVRRKYKKIKYFFLDMLKID